MNVSKYMPTERTEDVFYGSRLIQNHGRVQIPKEVRAILEIKDGDRVYWVVDKENKVHLRKAGKF